MRNQHGKPIKGVQSLFVLCVLSVGATIAPAQTVIHRFSNTNGESPWSPPVEGFDTNFYGTTSEGGAYQSGTVYKLNPEGKQEWVYSFCATSGCPDGAVPLAGVMQAADGWLYGAAWLGGANAGGTEYMIKTNGKQMTTLHSFCQEPNCADGDQPQGTVVATRMCLGPNQCGGYLYGTILQGGASGHGEIYQVLNAYIQGTVYSFCSLPNCADGSSPAGPLIQASDGNLYGTTESGGANNFGTVFQFNPIRQTLTTIYSFCQSSGCPDGELPAAGVIEGADGNFYGVTANGGVTSTGGAGEGVVFQLTPQGVLHVLHTFTGADGHGPVGLLQATDGNLYGMTQLGGARNQGTIFEVTTGGMFTKLHDFSGYGQPHGGLMQKTDGNLYGAPSVGGSTNSVIAQGVLFRYDTGLSPFVKLLPAVGSTNSTVGIYGPNLTGATAVLFNGVPSTVFAGSSTSIATVVPPGATTGPVTVVTPSGTITSNVSFSVLP